MFKPHLQKDMTKGRAASMSSVYRNKVLLFHILSSCITICSLEALFSLWSLNMYYQAQNLKRKYAKVSFYL